MKKILTICALFTGAASMLFSTSSCNKDDDAEEPAVICCEWTDDFGDSYEYCEDDALPAGATWDLVEAAASYYSGECN